MTKHAYDLPFDPPTSILDAWGQVGYLESRHGFPQRWIAGIDQDAIVAWGEPAVRTLEAMRLDVSLETLEVMTGAALIPLCDRQISAEGTE